MTGNLTVPGRSWCYLGQTVSSKNSQEKACRLVACKNDKVTTGAEFRRRGTWRTLWLSWRVHVFRSFKYLRKTTQCFACKCRVGLHASKPAHTRTHLHFRRIHECDSHSKHTIPAPRHPAWRPRPFASGADTRSNNIHCYPRKCFEVGLGIVTRGHSRASL
ncbi:hypothetical protein BDU57DRAFT_183658 [Ampelomyces quisqualis]|uniref:Uncharacterized protein n=1 Tax=Ampelomyces quisqualis TaxID=50730 RepID=A0A6A5QVV6_AMPQU|nr:hypothetical protein BDU57DRAFT_183658 [Ampelomyces quisqualis]